MDRILIDKPYINFQLYPEGDNLTSLLKYEIPENTSEAQEISLPGREYFNVFVYLADYAQLIVDQYAQSDYQVDTISISNGRIYYADYTLNEPAEFLLENISMHADRFNTEMNRTTFTIHSDINKVGQFGCTLVI